jgi:hypothetical protein
MNKPKYLTLALLSLLFLSEVALAQRRGDPDPTAACGACGAFVFVIIAAIVIVIALDIALMVWVARDAKSRGMDSAVIWMILVAFTSLIGLFIYILSRPQGNLIRCQSCNNNRLQASAKCPHCGNA